MNKLPLYPFDSQRCIGSVLEVTPNSAKINLPKAAIPEGENLYGHRLGAGEVGEFVFIEREPMAILGRIVMIKLPERERLTVEPELGKVREAHPLGTVQLLASVNMITGEVQSGLTQYPRLGSRVFSAHPELVAWIAEAPSRIASDAKSLKLDLAFLPEHGDTLVSILPEHLFGRHCAILGTTGGGKSWTVARLIEEARRFKSKLILLDATGEYYKLKDTDISHVHFGTQPDRADGSIEVVFPYRSLTEQDIFAIFTPSGQTQLPKLRAAMKSLKLAKLDSSIASNGIVKKAEIPKEAFEDSYKKHVTIVDGPTADFDIKKLARQIEEECVWPTGGTSSNPDPTKWGKVNENEKSYCISLITRIESAIHVPELACIFKPDGKVSIVDKIGDFLSDKEKRVLRISLRNVSFAFNAREVLANAIGRALLSKAREDGFSESPAVIFLDEAHQFLNKSLGDENNRYALDSFELIAKEGRKYSLCICISTQRPRDIPEGVLSQMGAMIVHRLTNEKDREIVERACSNISRSLSDFLPSLVPGEAMLVGVDFPIPITLKMRKPTAEPDSYGPNYQRYWNDDKNSPYDPQEDPKISDLMNALQPSLLPEGELYPEE